MKPYRPAPAPGHFIREELEARELAQRDLAFILGTSEQVVARLLSGKQSISPEMAKALGQAFDVSAEVFIRLQAAYDLANAKDPDEAVAERARWQNIYPVREMINRGWLLDGDHSGRSIETQLCHLFKAANSNEIAKPAIAAKKTNVGEPASGAQLAWLYRVIQIAEAAKNVPAYSARALHDSQIKLRALMKRPEGIKKVPDILMACGLRFIIVESLPNAKIDGVCIWLDSKTPVVGLSLRFDRIDNFWFVLCHEIAHVLNRDGQHENEHGWVLDVELEKERAGDNDKISKQERRANQLAANFCIPEHEMVSFVSRRIFFSERDVVAFAEKMNVHPGIVVGQIHNRTHRYDLLRKYLVKVREHVVPTRTVDGWGHQALLAT